MNSRLPPDDQTRRQVVRRARSGRTVWRLVASGMLLVCLASDLQAQQSPANPAATHPLAYINTSIENGSPLYWEIGNQGEVNIYLLYDQERESPNRANGHWHFQVQARPGSDLTLVLHNFDNVWNGKHGSPLNDQVTSFLSLDGKHWKRIETHLLERNRLQIPVHMETDSAYIARLEPYRLSDLDRLKESIRGNPLVEISEIGKTVEGRPLEIIRVGQPDAAHRVLLRARRSSVGTGRELGDRGDHSASAAR